MITTIPFQVVLDECHIQNIQSQCDIVAQGRNPANGILGQGAPFLSNLGSVNAATLQAAGIDLTASYNFDVAAGSVSALYYGNYTFKNDLQSSASADVVECAGEFGQFCGEPTPEYKHTVQVSYLQGPFTLSARWRLIGGVDADTEGLSDLSSSIGTTNYLDLTTQYAVNENIDLTLGVRNITGTDVPLLGSTVAEQANTFPATYTPFGREVFFGTSIRF